MSIIRDDCDERQTRVDRMIDEFHKAKSRRLTRATIVNSDDQRMKSLRDARAQAAVAGSPPARPSH